MSWKARNRTTWMLLFVFWAGTSIGILLLTVSFFEEDLGMGIGIVMTSLGASGFLVFGRLFPTSVTFGQEEFTEHRLLGPDRRWPYDQVAWVYLRKMTVTTDLGAGSDDELFLYTWSGKLISAHIPLRGAKLQRAEQFISGQLPKKLTHAVVGYSPELLKTWRTRESQPGAWEDLVAKQDLQERRLRL